MPRGGGADSLGFRPNKRRREREAEEEEEEEDELAHELQERAHKYERSGSHVDVDVIRDKKLKSHLQHTEAAFQDATLQAARAEILLPSEPGYLEAEGMERTHKFKQIDLMGAVDMNTARKKFSLKLNTFGPYMFDYTRNGRHVLLGGRKGHLALFDWNLGTLACELHVRETIRDVKFLHDYTMFAVAQRKYVYIYDHQGIELHCLRRQLEVNRLEFLPYHFLMVSVGKTGRLRYQDTSTGQLVVEHRTRLGECNVMRQNPNNAVIHLGHHNGVVTLWTPNMTTPVVRMLCHRGSVQAVAIDRAGIYMATSGLDGKMKIWDLRTLQQVQRYYTTKPAHSLDISQRGLLGAGYGSHVQVWKDALATNQALPYMTHSIPGDSVHDLHFCPFEDIMGISYRKGFSTIIVPGCGEPNFDSLEVNPYETKTQHRETVVHTLLDKLQPEMITLDPSVIGNVDRAPKEVIEEDRKLMAETNRTEKPVKEKRKTRGRSSLAKRLLRKQQNVVDAKRIELQQRLEKEEEARLRRKQQRKEENEGTALARFFKEKQ